MTAHVRVEGRGAATIHDVILTKIARPPVYANSPELDELKRAKKIKEKALERAQKTLTSLDTYMKTLTTEHTDPTVIGKLLEESEKVAEKWDLAVLDLKDELKKVEQDTEEERKKVTKTDFNEKLMYKASIMIHAEKHGEAEIALIYGMPFFHQVTRLLTQFYPQRFRMRLGRQLMIFVLICRPKRRPLP